MCLYTNNVKKMSFCYLFIYFLTCLDEYFVFCFFCSSGLRIIKAAAEIINETFDGILGANSRASSSYSACRPTQRRSKLKLISWDIWVKPTDFVCSVQTGPTKHQMQMQSCVNEALSSCTYALICAVYVHLIYFQIKFYCHCKRAVPCMTTPSAQ